eukprot:716811_1
MSFGWSFDDVNCQTHNCIEFGVFSILLTVLTILLIIAIFVFILYEMHQTSIRYVRFISNKPSYFPLYVSSVSDIVIFGMIAFWAMKLDALNTNCNAEFEIYCSHCEFCLWLYCGILIGFKNLEFFFIDWMLYLYADRLFLFEYCRFLF